MNRFTPGQEIEAEIVAISNDYIFIDLQSKSEGVISREELNDEQGNCTVKEGDKIKAYFLNEKHGELNFTTKIGSQKTTMTPGQKNREKPDNSLLESAYHNGSPVSGHVEKEIKGGFEVKIGDARAFCPYSQMGFKQREEAANYVGKQVDFKIMEFKEGGRNILVSNRAILEDEYKNHLESLKETFKEGMLVSGVIKSIQDFGCFVDIEGFQALLPVSEISFDRVNNISEVLSVGQEIKANILSIDWKRERISISMKALLADPWKNISQKYPVDSRHEASIVRIAEYGLFANLEPGIDGLIHVSELSLGNRNTNLKAKYKIGQKLEVAVIEADEEQKRISLKLASSVDEDNESKKFIEAEDSDDGGTYNPFAALLKK